MVSVVNGLGVDKRELLEAVERDHGGVGNNLEAAIEVLKSMTPAERGGIRAVVPTLEAVAHWCSDILTSSVMTVHLRWGDMTVADVIGLMGVVIGFVLALGWDTWQDYRHVKAELHRSARSIEQELGTNLALLSTDQDLLSEDTKAADGQREVVQPLELLSTTAGESAYLRGSLEADTVELAIKLRAVYSSISILNQRIENREAYRLTNGAKSNYHGRRKLINQDLQQLIEETRNGINAFLAELKARHLA